MEKHHPQGMRQPDTPASRALRWACSTTSHLAACTEGHSPQGGINFWMSTSCYPRAEAAPGSPPQLPPLFPADLSAPSLWSCTPSGVQTLQNDDGAGPHRKSGQGGCSFESWLCRLAGALITHTKDPLLRMLHGIVVLKAKHVLEPAAACIPELQQTLPRKQLSAMTPDADEGVSCRYLLMHVLAALERQQALPRQQVLLFAAAPDADKIKLSHCYSPGEECLLIDHIPVYGCVQAWLLLAQQQLHMARMPKAYCLCAWNSNGWYDWI
eukprot:1146088-Pelagomonas_calceolata.AAC.6